MTAPARILLVEAHTAVREAMAAALDQHPDLEVVAQAGSLGEARERLSEVDVAVIELRLPDGSAIELVGELRAQQPSAQVLVLGANADRGEVADAVRAGAAAVLHEAVDLEVVRTSIRRLADGEPVMPAEEVIDLLRLAGRRLEREHRDRLVLDRLTPREREVLQTLAEGLGSRASAERLCISVRTQRNHVANIEAKLGVHSQLQALVLALRYGVVSLPAG